MNRAAKTKASSARKMAAKPAKTAARSVLVVDDDRITRHVLSKVLTSGGYAVTTVKDGLEALETLSASQFDLILLDVWMPRMSGLDLLAELRERKARPRVVVMTTDDTPETMLRAVRDQVGSSRVDLQACKLEYSIVSPK